MIQVWLGLFWTPGWVCFQLRFHIVTMCESDFSHISEKSAFRKFIHRHLRYVNIFLIRVTIELENHLIFFEKLNWFGAQLFDCFGNILNLKFNTFSWTLIVPEWQETCAAHILFVNKKATEKCLFFRKHFQLKLDYGRTRILPC